ncbi:MAG: DUF2267 domain-containing protein [Solirubrobacteraceae bacterium]
MAAARRQVGQHRRPQHSGALVARREGAELVAYERLRGGQIAREEVHQRREEVHQRDVLEAREAGRRAPSQLRDAPRPLGCSRPRRKPSTPVPTLPTARCTSRAAAAVALARAAAEGARLIADLDSVDDETARDHARAVFSTLRRSIGEEDYRDVVSQLPDDYEVLVGPPVSTPPAQA